MVQSENTEKKMTSKRTNSVQKFSCLDEMKMNPKTAVKKTKKGRVCKKKDADKDPQQRCPKEGENLPGDIIIVTQDNIGEDAIPNDALEAHASLSPISFQADSVETIVVWSILAPVTVAYNFPMVMPNALQLKYEPHTASLPHLNVAGNDSM